MNKDNLTIRIAINKPTPEPVTPKKKASRLPLISALLVPILAVALYQIFQPAPQSPSTNTALSQSEAPDIAATNSLAKPEPALMAEIPAAPAKSLTIEPTTPPHQPLALQTHQTPVKTLSPTNSKGTSSPVSMPPLIHALPPFLQRAQLSMGINQLEPKNELSAHVHLRDLPDQRLYMFTELSGKTGQTIHHRWRYKNQIMATIPIKVGGDRWRCYSSKYVGRKYLGEWVVEIIDEKNKVLYTQTIIVNG